MFYLTVLGVPCVVLLIGILQRFIPCKHINYIYGYRSKISMKNEKNWIYAQILSGKVFIVLGIFEIFATVIIVVILRLMKVYCSKFQDAFLLTQVALMLLASIYIEVSLRKKFKDVS